MSKPAVQQPGWVCEECGNRYKAGKWKLFSTWHYGKCGVPATEVCNRAPRLQVS